MWKELVRFVLVISAAWLIPTSSMAACEDALVRSTYQFNNSVKNDWRLATLVTQSVWDEARHNEGVSAIIYGVPIGASYSDYKTRVQNLMQSHNESYSHEQLLNIAWTGLDPNSVTAYQDCLQLEAVRIPGLHVGVRAADRSSILLLVNWSQPGAGPIEITWTRPTIEGQSIPVNLPPGSTTLSVPRPRAALNLAASYRGFTSEVVTLTPLPPPQKGIEPTDKFRFVLIKSASGDCNSRTIEFRDRYFNQIFTPTLFYNCSYIDWTAGESTLPQIARGIGLADDNSRWALVRVDGDCNGRVFQLFDKQTQRTHTITLGGDNCQTINYNGHPASPDGWLSKVLQRGGLPLR